ncbi:nucleoside kinase, partial [bacterium]|nr:nucleoside kinase [bacterium]
KIKQRVAEIIEANSTIHCEEKQTKVVNEMFAERKHHSDKISLLETLGTPYCRFYRIDDYIDYYNGVLLPSTSYLGLYDLVPYYDGMLLCVPNRENPEKIEQIEFQPKMFEIFKEYMGWNKIMNLNNVGEFNGSSKIGQSTVCIGVRSIFVG